MNVQIIQKDGKPEWAVLPYENYLSLMEHAEMLQDVRDYDAAKHALRLGEEPIPSEITFAILDGENPIKVWREYRGFAQQQLAEASGLNSERLAEIESGQLQPTAEEACALAKALNLAEDYFLD